MTIKRIQRRQQLRRQIARIQIPTHPPPGPGHNIPYVPPQIAESRIVKRRTAGSRTADAPAGRIVRNRHPGDFDDARLNGIHQRKIAHRPRKQRPLGIPRTPQEKRRRRKVNRSDDPGSAPHRFQPGDPQPGGGIVLLRLRPLLLLQRPLPRRLGRPLPVAVMPLIVQRQYARQPQQLRHHPPQHLPLRLQRIRRRPRAPLHQPPRPRRHRLLLPPPKSVVIGYHHPGLPHRAQQLLWR